MSDQLREIVLDTETTGLNPQDGHRIIEIGALELINHMPTGKQLHLYINPERVVEEQAIKVHGITNEFLADKPLFAEIVDEFLDFIGEDVMVIHNAAFDMGFINAELKRLGFNKLPDRRAIDTMMMARRKFPGAKASLDALCHRFNIDNAHRDLHGALVDADLLAEVYLELIGGRQVDLGLSDASIPDPIMANSDHGSASTHSSDLIQVGQHESELLESQMAGPIRPARPHAASPDEIALHEAFLDSLKDPLWRR